MDFYLTELDKAIGQIKNNKEVLCLAWAHRSPPRYNGTLIESMHPIIHSSVYFECSTETHDGWCFFESSVNAGFSPDSQTLSQCGSRAFPFIYTLTSSISVSSALNGRVRKRQAPCRLTTAFQSLSAVLRAYIDIAYGTIQYGTMLNKAHEHSG